MLKEDLYSMRNAIDQYSEDKGYAPVSLEQLVIAGYLRQVPNDPFTNSNSTWQVVREEMTMGEGSTSRGIIDVHSASTETSTEGSSYKSW